MDRSYALEFSKEKKKTGGTWGGYKVNCRYSTSYEKKGEENYIVLDFGLEELRRTRNKKSRDIVKTGPGVRSLVQKIKRI